MALSNNQFVESRVYDDDVDVSTEGNTSKVCLYHFYANSQKSTAQNM